MSSEVSARKYEDMAAAARANGNIYERHVDIVRALGLLPQIRGAYGEYNTPLHEVDRNYVGRIRAEAMAAFDGAVPKVPLLKKMLRGRFMLQLLEHMPSEQEPLTRGHRLLDRANEMDQPLREMYENNITKAQEFAAESFHSLAEVAMHDAIERGVEFPLGVAGLGSD